MSLRLSHALIRKNLTNIFKTTHHVEPCICTLIDHGQQPITVRIAFTSLYKRKFKEIGVENLYVGINAKRVKGHDKLRVKDNQGLSQLYIDLGRAKSEAPIDAF